MAHSESWQDFYRRKVAQKEGVQEHEVRVVQRHDHVPIPLKNGTAETFVIELAFDKGNDTVTIFAWDDPPFRCVRKEPKIDTPARAVLAVLVKLGQQQT